MRKWQILEFDGKPYYAFVPEDDTPIREDLIPEYSDDVDFLIEDHQSVEDYDDEIEIVDPNYDNSEEGDCVEESNRNPVRDVKKSERLPEVKKTVSLPKPNSKKSNSEPIMIVDDPEVEIMERATEPVDVKPTIINGKIQPPEALEKTANPADQATETQIGGELYKVKVESGVVVLEKVNTVVESIGNIKKPGTIFVPESNVTKILPHDDEDDDEEFEGLANPSNDDDEPVLVDFEDMDIVEELDEDDAVAAAELATNEENEKNSGVSLKCKVCSEMFQSSLAFRKHVAWTHKKKVCIRENGLYICSVCDYRTTKKDLFAAHLQRKHDTWSRGKRQSSNNFFPCTACGFVCRSKHSLQSHFIRKHTDRYEHQCKFCPKKFKVKGDLTNHVRFHHKEKPVKCDVCGKECLNTGSLYVHQKWAHYKPKFECHICHRRMVTQQNLDQHMLMQHVEREKIVCAECGKTFTKKDSFKRHMSVHTGAKPYKCVICNKPFARRSQLRQHLLIHTGKRPFVCDICNKAFTQKPGLICHRKTHPGNHPPLPVMPIGELVKEFLEEFEAGESQKKKIVGEIVEQLEQLREEEEEEGVEEEEEYEEEEEEEIIEEIIVNEDKDSSK